MTKKEEELLNRCRTQPLLCEAMEAAFLAAAVLRQMHANVCLLVDEKSGDRGLVTEFDKEAERIIRKYLSEHSGYSILGEEGGLSGRRAVAGTPEAGREKMWVVDPIDGTTNFSRGIPLCAISIALVEDGVCRLGVVYNPFLDECFFAEADYGAFLNAEPIRVTPFVAKGKPIVFVNSGYAPEFELCAQTLAENLRGRVVHRHFGTTALEICYVACGRAEAFASIGDELWDYAGAVAISREAGAAVVDWEGAVWTIQRSDILVAAPAVLPFLAKDVATVFHTKR